MELSGGLVEIDSSSGSSSGLDDSSSSDGDPEKELLAEIKDRAFMEEVPAGESFFSHKKSGIMHRQLVGANSFVCKLKRGSNHIQIASTFYFKYPKCSKCFAERHKNASPLEGTSDLFDRASKKLKAQ